MSIAVRKTPTFTQLWLNGRKVFSFITVRRVQTALWLTAEEEEGWIWCYSFALQPQTNHSIDLCLIFPSWKTENTSFPWKAVWNVLYSCCENILSSLCKRQSMETSYRLIFFSILEGRRNNLEKNLYSFTFRRHGCLLWWLLFSLFSLQVLCYLLPASGL